ncbi:MULTISPECIES: methyltransferase domain-containing protein [Prochlorococcus]|uniref:UbiE/COQ5 family methyltransferase n=1 Tax=Prochlorococcus marinus (strain SARG / CCMP1375 / SS120) TaxID=167539 RepID=Q7VA08_PROMA|nr:MULTISPECIES: methyltransferase domain-containing protein [Prochlorococcus]AAQ00705.1 ubiE/COQ5 family methyltransferase [Prochlorococcus marinus subsp. marinus str. CCMP1375]KGG10799.1 2-methyl-6-phytyl-1,4-benzoquinone methyltransferase [Prochlorococcus marinus str. LG]KGG20147.1 2-methyl-6-phytyl-1,4-benzoquinone methyltransferase [Prochlorococcus marinus str. SS2]KGG24047.1 2-methyl-6-phytyl-1,4-benzoquinone methyltransferase [Prochlorococcus marinus str. SS35]KGG31694.1 2-methyl-6-phyt
MIAFLLPIVSLLVLSLIFLWLFNDRKYKSSESVSSAYDSWTNDRLLEKLWGEHIHLGYYENSYKTKDFRQAKIDFVHKLAHWSGLSTLPKGSRIIDIGCGIGGSSRILAKDYGFDVVGITISSEQVKRANQLTPKELKCHFEIMNALNLKFEDGSFDGVWSVEAGPHILNKQLFADEMLRVLRPGGVLAVADWNRRDYAKKEIGFLNSLVLKQLLNQWSHPDFATIYGFRNNLSDSIYSAGRVETDDWTKYTIPSWNDSIIEGIRRPNVFFDLGLGSFFKAIREVPTIVLMRWAFHTGLMQFGVFRSRG